MTELTWADPPEKSSKRGAGIDWGTVAEQLKANPGQWALVNEGAKSVSSTGYASKRYGVEVTTRKNADGLYSIWARWPE